MEKWRVLAIDDDADILEIIQVTLGDEYEVIASRDPLLVVRYIKDVEPDLIILDIMMPKMSGYQVYDAVKRIPKFSAIPIMFLTAKNNPSDAIYGYKLGATSYLTKPFNPQRLLKNVDSFFKYTPPCKTNKKYKFDPLQKYLEKAGFQMFKKKIQDSEDASKERDQWID